MAGGHAWQGGMHGGGCPWWGVSMVGVCVWQAVACVVGGVWQEAYMAGVRRAYQILRDTVNERAVRILLECILVLSIQKYWHSL